MSGTLDNWLHGAPVVETANGGDFSLWVSGSPLVGNGTPTVTVLSNAIVFVGEISRATVRGRIITARCRTGGAVFDRQVPRFRMQTGCNHVLFDTGCGLVRTAWRFTATIADAGDPGFPFEFELEDLQRVSGPTPAYFEHWFAGGWAEFGSGATWCRRPILRSSTVTGGALTITLARDPLAFPEVGEEVSLFPGCDGRWETCGAHHGDTNPQGKFNNRLNFGGHPYMPIGNPSLVKVSASVGGGKKS
jgi:hypothetical protein